jgi:tyrosinase
MRIEFVLNNSNEASARYLTWTPSTLRLRLIDVPPGSVAVDVKIGELRKPNGGALRFSAAAGGAGQTSLKLKLPANGQSVSVFVRGHFGAPSKADGDVSIVVTDKQQQVLGALPVMVRVRKDANTLTEDERDRFLSAFAQLNDKGAGRFVDFRNMHVDGKPSAQAHGGPGFLPWHRAYLLDLERELQAIDPTVSLPYWRFDRAAKSLFTRDFMGVPDSIGSVRFSPSNPLQFWATDGVQGINRRLEGIDPAKGASGVVLNEAATIGLGSTYTQFRDMQFNPHNQAHVQYFSGSISDINTAAKDPLFFLLHCNVDRLWAKWQREFGRFDANTTAAYDSGPTPTSLLAGHNINDSLWPWNGIVTPPRPATAPGGALARSPCVVAPGPKPLVRDMFDYQGAQLAAAQLGFAYDDVRLS